MANPENLLYSKDHEWAKIEGDTATVGITDYAQNSLGDIVYVELPRVGQTIAPHASIGVVESVKAVSELFSPVGGEVVEGWMYRVKVSGDPAPDLLSAADYEKLVTTA